MTQWLTPQEAADYIRVSLPLISEAVNRGDLPAYPVGKGRNYRLDASEVDAWMKSRSYEPR
jgi:excisionase family DNA binding protein